jgi:glycosyltransferase involved in cell wall biosynthesis
MASGLPIVSTRVGGVAEVAPESLFPWFCEAGSASALADAMLHAAHSDQLAFIGAEARRLASMHYGITHMGRRYEALYEKLLSRL